MFVALLVLFVGCCLFGDRHVMLANWLLCVVWCVFVVRCELAVCCLVVD